jgi:hypothetical protein
MILNSESYSHLRGASQTCRTGTWAVLCMDENLICSYLSLMPRTRHHAKPRCSRMMSICLNMARSLELEPGAHVENLGHRFIQTQMSEVCPRTVLVSISIRRLVPTTRASSHALFPLIQHSSTSLSSRVHASSRAIDFHRWTTQIIRRKQ